MVVAVNTSLAENAVATSWSPDDFAVWAEAARLERVKQRYEVQLLILFDYTRIAEPHYDA